MPAGEPVTDDDWLAACPADELPVGGVRRVDRHRAAPVALYRLADGFYATEDFCSHGIASLSEGTLDGDVIECPFHGGAFNVRTGEPESSPCVTPLKTFAVAVRDGMVLIGPAQDR
jgi:nitrite reductase/ring-hydroxylating ferredoxin subunit